MFEKTWALLKAIWEAVCRQDWVSIRGSLGLVHALWTAVVICILVGVVIFGLIKYLGWLRRHPIPALLCGLIFLSGLMGIMMFYDYCHQPAHATTCGSVCAPEGPITVSVPAAKGWVTVLANSESCPLRFHVKGKGTVTDGSGRDYGPSGRSSQRAGDMTPWPAGPAGALLGYISNGSPTIVVGKGERITLPPGTELMCSANLRVGSAFGAFEVTASDFEFLE